LYKSKENISHRDHRVRREYWFR